MTLASSPHLACEVDVDDFHTQGYLRVRLAKQVHQLILDITQVGVMVFRRTEVAKLRDRLEDEHEGWQAFGGEFSITADRPDLHESFWVTRRHAPRASRAYSEPARILHLKMMTYLGIIQEIEASILIALLNLYGLEISGLAQVGPSMDSDLQLLYYEPARQTRRLLQDAHEDSLSLTFTWADSPGLELLDNDGHYRAPNLQADELAILPGEIMSLLSGGRICPQIHRVVRHADQKERLTLSYFSAPDVAPISQISAWISSPTNAGVCIADRIRTNRLKYLVP